jgi:hypothetical protein
MMSLIAAPWFVKLYQRNQVKSAAFRSSDDVDRGTDEGGQSATSPSP